MQHTLIAVFDNRGDAERARDELLASGFSRQEVRISMADATGQTDSLTGRPTGGMPEEAHEQDGFGASVRNFFRDIFGTDNSPHVQKYSDLVSRGHHVLTVLAADEPEVERAADIVERHGPVDIDEKAAEWAGGAPVAHSESMRMSGAGGMQQSALLSQQFERDRNLFQQQSLSEGAPMGTTYQEPMDLNPNYLMGGRGNLQGSSLEGSAMQAGSQGGSMGGGGSEQRDTSMAGGVSTPPPDAQVRRAGAQGVPQPAGSVQWKDDENYYRSHWNKIYAGAGGSYEDYAPAYSYGAETGRSDQYRGRSWNEVEAELKTSWDARDTSGGQSTWDKFKAAIRHGWERVTADTDYRGDWTTNYSSLGGSYDDYAPAYSYGYDMARSDKYRERQWDEAETDLRSEWEARGAGGASTWEKFKAAVRHGWDRVTSDTEYRSHWDQTYSATGGSYDEYAPAYKHGEETARSQLYRNRPWDDVEADVRQTWESRGTPGESTWEHFKAAIKHGWDRIAHR